MDTPHVYNLEDLAGMSDAQILQILDASWPWPLDGVQSWFENLYNSIATWLNDAKQWIIDQIKPLVAPIWNWIESAKQWIVDNVVTSLTSVWSWIQSTGSSIVSDVGGLIASITKVFQDGINFVIQQLGPYFQWLYDWLQGAFGNLWSSLQPFLQDMQNTLGNLGQVVADKVAAINDWFSNEFIDPFIDWLLKFPGNFTGALGGLVNGLATRLESWLSHHSPGFPGILIGWWNDFLDWFAYNVFGIDRQTGNVYNQSKAIWSLVGLGLAGIFSGIIDGIGSLAPIFESFAGRFGAWLLQIGGGLGTWLVQALSASGRWLLGLIPAALSWIVKFIMPRLVPLISSGAILALDSTGDLQKLVDKFITPGITNIFEFFESQGPVSPSSSKDIGAGITRLASFTISGLAAMTIGGELLSPIKQLGLGNISAIIYDLIDYKTLTMAFMGVLAAVYIKAPLTYYYNKAARPKLPNEMALTKMLSEQDITVEQFKDYMGFEGYSDEWIDRISPSVYRPMSPYMLRSLATAGELDDNFLDIELKAAGYRPTAMPYIKQMMARLASTALKTLSTGTAMTRYKEGFDDEAALRQNLSALGESDQMLDRFVFAANLDYFTSYQTELKGFFIDAYHRRDIEADELRQDLASVGLPVDRIDLVVQAQSIKRLKAAAGAEPPEIKIQEETIRARRDKNLITRDAEISALVSLGRELAYATAIADQDDVKLAVKVPLTPPPTIPYYETVEGKVKVDTARWQRLKQLTDPATELTQLRSIGVPDSLGQAYAAEDSVRVQEKNIVKPSNAVSLYETEEGKTRTDTIRRLTRAGQLTQADEVDELLALEMPQGLADAIAENDVVRMKKGAA